MAQKSADYAWSTFRAGILLATGLIFGIEGVVYAATEYYASGVAADRQATTSCLLQLYGGYFCFLFLAFLFVINAAMFDTLDLNYHFIFGLDKRDSINWRQLSEIPSAFACILGVCMWLNFHPSIGPDTMYIYWPIVLIGVSVLLLFAPTPGFFYSSSRRWLSSSLYRLILLPGFVDVQFQDFFLGDMFCSLTYAMGNVEVFFCLYANTSNDQWINPGQCNSTSSRLLGFFTTLPGIWRALQCIRRYRDESKWYPHLPNLGKYTCTILQYMSLSLWRLREHNEYLKTAFITMASINSIYCIYWDIIHDWSLSPKLLQQVLAYHGCQWAYHFVIMEDIILRFLWVVYVIVSRDYQHSSLLSFMIAVLEVGRRGIWITFRVENEDCHKGERQRELDAQLRFDGVADAAPDQESPVARALRRVGSVVFTAHTQDYVRRQPTTVEERNSDDEN